MKNLLIAAAVIAAPSAAIAGPYVEAEMNAGFTGSDYEGAVLETHLGYESALGDSSSWYIQGGPALIWEDGVDTTTTELSGKVGISTDVTEQLEAYGEVSAITQGEIDFDQDLDMGVKAGLKFSF
jgi:opacity protein-like surface antigen